MNDEHTAIDLVADIKYNGYTYRDLLDDSVVEGSIEDAIAAILAGGE